MKEKPVEDVTGGLKNVQRPFAEIFVELESHPTASAGISM
jgi:hypothetical protein